MFWEEDEDKSIPYEIPDDIVDISFPIKCKKLSIDHIASLSESIQVLLPWCCSERGFAIHPIHVAETGNGWQRPEDREGAYLWPSRRTRMSLRVPQARVDDCNILEGQTIEVAGDQLTIKSGYRTKKLSNASVIFARQVLSSEDEDENTFLQRMHEEIFDLTEVRVRKMICGMSHKIKTIDEIITTRHLMIADLESIPSIKIQQIGLGGKGLLGCGIFLPHKGIKSLNSTE
ncbi:MAG: type I-MYXAN CRISPR-associated protein Cas6/Cmx6 [Thiotrichaceae bacterium]|nr:type I-MYXAN CRISPR-associated protein Cas6/Cmx6 [Thiotrichaceae bacterium]